MITVKATREGMPGGKTSTGYLIESIVPFVALPAFAALRQWVRVQNPANGKSIRALVLDVGPWNEHDYAYVFQPATLPSDAPGPATALEEHETPIPVEEASTRGGIRPAAETQKDQFGRVTNGAGIDLGAAVWTALGMTDNTDVSWEFEL